MTNDELKRAIENIDNFEFFYGETVAVSEKVLKSISENYKELLKLREEHLGCRFCNGEDTICISADGCANELTIKELQNYQPIYYCPMCGKEL